jgi:hypothetical protein
MDQYGKIVYGYEITNDDPIEWVATTQELPGTYIVLNSEPITIEQAVKYDGELKGM